jgi:hypothetical protein
VFDVWQQCRTDGQSWRNIPELLKEYAAYGGLVVNWRVFSSSGHKTRPQNVSTLEAYTSCIADDTYHTGNHNSHVKAIVNVPHTKVKWPSGLPAYTVGCLWFLC